MRFGIIQQNNQIPPLVNVYQTPGTFNTSSPEGCTQMIIEAYGSAASGGGTEVLDTTDGGGASAGCYSKKTINNPSEFDTILVTVAAGVSGVLYSDGNDGNDSSVSIQGTTVCLAKGGKKGYSNGTKGVSTTTGCIGDVFYKGGDGSNSVPGTSSGAGGGGAGPNGAGGNASGTTGGTGNGGYAGNGGNGLTTQGNGNPGTQAGGAGSGSKTSTNSYSGGPGAPGTVVITYIF